MPATNDADRVHDNVRDWTVHAENTEGDSDATVGKTTITDLNRFVGTPLAEVFVFISQDDGAIVVQIDTAADREVPVRVEVNDTRPSVYDQIVAQ